MEYLSSLGKTQTAAVQRDADIGVAEAERDAGIRVGGTLNYKCTIIQEPISESRTRSQHFQKLAFLFLLCLSMCGCVCFKQEAECKKEMMDVKFLADTKMADSKRELEMQRAAFNQEVNTKVL